MNTEPGRSHVKYKEQGDERNVHRILAPFSTEEEEICTAVDHKSVKGQFGVDCSGGGGMWL